MPRRLSVTNHLTPAARRRRDDRIVEMYGSGKSYAAIGAVVGIDWSSVRKIVIKRGVPRRSVAPRRYSPPKSKLRVRALVAKVAHLYDTGPGTSGAALAEKLGLDYPTVLKHLVALGVKVRPSAGIDSVVTIPQVRRIKAEIARGGTSLQEIADRYGVRNNVINAIANGRTWAHVPWPKGTSYTGRSPGTPRKLTEAIVRRIKADLQKPELSLHRLAARYGVATCTIWMIAKGKIWVCVPWPNGRRYVARRGPWKILLTPEKVRRIKVLLCSDEFTHVEIGDKFGVSRAVVGQIARGYLWKNVPWPTKSGYPWRGRGFRALSTRKAGHVLDIEERRRFERRKGERAWEENRGARSGR